MVLVDSYCNKTLPKSRRQTVKQVKNCSDDPRFLKSKLFQLIGCIKNVCIGSFFSVDVINALFEFLFVLRYSKLDFCFCETFIYNKKMMLIFLFTSFNSHNGLQSIKAITENQLHDFLINSRHSHDKYCFIIAHYEGKQSP